MRESGLAALFVLSLPGWLGICFPESLAIGGLWLFIVAGAGLIAIEREEVPE